MDTIIKLAMNIQKLQNSYTSSGNNTTYQCWRKLDTVLYVGFASMIALPLTVALSFLLRRDKRYLQCCDGRPGVAYPWDVLVHKQARMQTVLSMLLLCFPAYMIINQDSVIFEWAPATASWVKTPIKLAGILLTGLSLHPIFLSSSKPCALTHLVALVDVCFQTIIVTLPLFLCIFDDLPDDNLFNILKALPSIVAGLCLIVVIVIKLYKSIIKQRYFEPYVDPEVIETFLQRQENYVRLLFKKTLRNQQGTPVDSAGSSAELKKKPNFAGKKLNEAQYVITEWAKDAFHYPVSVLCSIAASSTLLYYAVLKSIQTITTVKSDIDYIWFDQLDKTNDTRKIRQVFAAIVVNGSLNFGLLLDESNFTPVLSYVFNCLHAILITAIVLTAVNNIIVLILIFVNYRSNVLNAYAGNYVNMIPRANVMPSSAIVGLCRYGGYQVGYIGWAIILQFAIFTLVMCFVWYTMLMPIVFGYDLWFTALIKRIWPTLIIGISVGLLQSLIPRFVFVVDMGRKLAVRRRTIFMVWSYYSFIISTVMGLVSCLLRLVKAFVIAFVFLARLDWCSLPPRFRFLDGGHSAYMGQLHSDVSHSHPVMITFIEILKRGAQLTRETRSVVGSCLVADSDAVLRSYTKKSKVFESIKKGSLSKLPTQSEETSCGSSLNQHLVYRSKDARVWKWLVAYTLINNPTLLQDRKTIKLKKLYEEAESNTTL